MRARVLVCLLALAVGVVSGGTPAGAQAATASIAGTVTSPEGEPLEGVCVEAFGDGSGDAVTAGDGSYRVEGLPAGDYTVGFNTCLDPLPGFAPEFFDDAQTVDDATTVTLEEAQTRTGIDAALELTGSISGTVTDDDTGNGLEGVCVVALGGETGTLGDGETDADGSYVVANLPAGEYLLVFGDCAEPFVHIPEFYDDVQIDGQEPVREPDLVVVASGEDTGGIDAGLEEGGAVEGTVTAVHTGREQPLVCVGLFAEDAQDDDAPVALSLTGLAPADELASSPGSYVLPGVPPGRYVVAFNPAICQDDGYATTWFPDAATRDDAAVLEVRKGETFIEVDAVVTPLPSISFACPFDVPPDEARFSDVPEGNVHRRAIECLALFGVVAGRGDGSYGPAVPVTRAQLASFVARTLEAAGVTLPEDPANAFDDDNGDVHERAINQLAALGVVSGKGDRRYAPAEQVNRAQMATFLVNAYEEATGVALRAPEDRFSDDQGNVHEAAINKVATAGITAGTGSGYVPSGLVRRDAMASFLARLLDRVQRDRGFDFGGPEGSEPPAEGSMSSFAVRTAPPREAAVGSLRRLAENAARR